MHQRPASCLSPTGLQSQHLESPGEAPPVPPRRPPLICLVSGVEVRGQAGAAGHLLSEAPVDP